MLLYWNIICIAIATTNGNKLHDQNKIPPQEIQHNNLGTPTQKIKLILNNYKKTKQNKTKQNTNKK
jgi:hypothetical protein